MNERKLKNNKGITLISLIITIAVMFIVAGTTVYISLDRFEINRLKKMYNDIELLSDKVANYYLKYNGLPVIKDSENNAIEYTYTPLNFDKNINDSGSYYILDLEAMEGISLNYGREGYNNPNTSDDVYIINKASHVIYYVKGIELDGEMYYTIPKDENSISDTIPPTKPEIKVISGTLNSDGEYTSDVELEIIPGKDNWSGVEETICTITKDGTETEDVVIGKKEQNYIYKITNNGTYVITAITKDSSGYSSNVAEMPPVTIKKSWINNGDGTLTNGSETVEIGKTTYTNAVVLEKLGLKEYTGTYTGDWQVIGLEGDKLKLVSVNNVAESVKLGKTDESVYKTNEAGNPILDEEGNKILKEEIVNSNVDGDLEFKKAAWSYAHAVDTLDKVAQKETGITSARSITIDDIYDIIGEENVDKSSNPSYGETYKFYCDDTTCNNTSDSKVYSCKKNDDGTWTTGRSIASAPAYAKFTYANNKKETRTIGTLADGTTINKGEVELPNNYFDYTLTDAQKNAIGSLKEGYYWLASPCVACGSRNADFNVRRMYSGNIRSIGLFGSRGAAGGGSNGVRAVVSI